MITHGHAPKEFGVSTVIPIPKNHNSNTTDSNNFRGIALSSIFCKVLDNIVLTKFQDKLCTSDLQFGFKAHNSTNMCTMVLKETVNYYIRNKTSVFCTFLDASKAFDRVHYCKLFRLLIKRELPACIIRILINLYTVNEVRVLWSGYCSVYFVASNGVKQGGVLSPILFCIYIDNLLIELSSSGVGCYIGSNFTGALAYADDIVLITPTPSAMRRMLSVCSNFATSYDVLFNAEKSKFLVVAPYGARSSYKDMSKCCFKIGDHCIENVKRYPHLGHIISDNSSDIDDITSRCNTFNRQTNYMLCCFDQMDMLVKLRLFLAYCCSYYGCELWSLCSDSVEIFCTAWRKAVRRVLNLPVNTHCYLLPLLAKCLPISDEIYKRSARFIYSCLSSSNKLVAAVAQYSIHHARYSSLIGSNGIFICSRYDWSVDDFKLQRISLSNERFKSQYASSINDTMVQNASFLHELLMIRDGIYTFSDQRFSITPDELGTLIAELSAV